MTELAQYGILGLAIAGTVSALKSAFPDKIHGIVTIVVALAIGVLAGFSGIKNLTPLAENLNPMSGALIALATVGIMTLADRFRTGQTST